MSDLSAFQPVPDALTGPFWDGARGGRLILARCPRCRAWQHPPLEMCRACAVPLQPEAAPLWGVVYSGTVMRHPAVPLYPTPYTVVIVEVGGVGGPRIVTRVVGTDGDVAPGTRVDIAMRPLPGGDFMVPVALVSTREEVR
ncbi:Zn-ribbon domain-containing OB-fold protein [Acrocarpospora catenulata]|uniref:Zn-ribbon domain-containing OB-fold protein n=1 Tax=Acrocarpospora catenulata TaxID=2836182 RepID=UPI001BD9A272|nr:OB-fold domain-containing protein [Acrocarpospora catenulata]